VREFVTLLEKAEFWKLDTEEKRDKVRYETKGIQWVLEGVRNREYHVVDRLSQTDRDFVRACIFLMSLTPNSQSTLSSGVLGHLAGRPWRRILHRRELRLKCRTLTAIRHPVLAVCRTPPCARSHGQRASP
jgi:hypothetical protein